MSAALSWQALIAGCLWPEPAAAEGRNCDGRPGPTILALFIAQPRRAHCPSSLPGPESRLAALQAGPVSIDPFTFNWHVARQLLLRAEVATGVAAEGAHQSAAHLQWCCTSNEVQSSLTNLAELPCFAQLG